MRMAEINWTRGLTRLYLLVVVVWLSYWLVWVPLDWVRGWEQLALATDDSAKRSEYWAHANLVAQWRELFQEMVRSPVVVLATIVLPPALGYGILLGILATVRWILRGFRASNPPNKALQRTTGSEGR